MKPVYKCDYCSFMGTEDEVEEHEPRCFQNYDQKGCYTCKNRGELTIEENNVKYVCKAGIDIPAGNIYHHCNLYDEKEKTKYYDLIDNMFRGVF